MYVAKLNSFWLDIKAASIQQLKHACNATAIAACSELGSSHCHKAVEACCLKESKQSVLLQKAKTACIDKANNACSNIIQGRPAMICKHESLTRQSQL